MNDNVLDLDIEDDPNNINISKSICIGSLINQNKLIDKKENSKEPMENVFKLNETKYILKEGEYINEGIKIIKFLFETNTSKFYLANVEEINSEIIIKSTQLTITDDNISIVDKATEDLKTIQILMHPNIISYFNIDVSFSESEDIMNINTSMDYFKGISLSQYLFNHNKKNKVIKGLPTQKVKLITKGILEGLDYLSSNGITHFELNPMNVMVNENDLSQIKIINYALRVTKEDIQRNPYYSSPELSFNKKISKATDIWSLGAIVFELFTGKKPYYDQTPFNALCILAQYISPIEAGDDKIKDLIYDKANRCLLDFLLKCFRADEKIRPSAVEMLMHKFLL